MPMLSSAQDQARTDLKHQIRPELKRSDFLEVFTKQTVALSTLLLTCH